MKNWAGNSAIAALLPISLLLGVWIAPPTAHLARAESWSIEPGVTFVAATVEQGRAVLSQRDAFISRLGPFDRQVRLQTADAVSEQQYLDHMAAQVLPWSERQREVLGAAIEAIRPQLKKWNLPWPGEVLFVMTTGKDEPGASGYCRGNAVVLPRRSLARDSKRLQSLLIHELFHVLSNQNPDWRRKMYAVVGFRPCNEVPWPDALRNRRLTNPDAPTMNYRTQVVAGDERVSIVPILYASEETYDPERGGTLFDYLNFRLMVIDQQEDRWAPRVVDGQPVLLDAKQTPSYFDAIGRNTSYIIHPEEVLAENFVLLITGQQQVPTPRVLDAMRTLVARPSAANGND